MNQSGGPYGRQGRSAQPGLFGGFNSVPPPQEVFNEWKNIWSAISAVLLSSANNLRLGVQWFATHATAGKPTPGENQAMYQAQQTMSSGSKPCQFLGELRMLIFERSCFVAMSSTEWDRVPTGQQMFAPNWKQTEKGSVISVVLDCLVHTQTMVVGLTVPDSQRVRLIGEISHKVKGCRRLSLRVENRPSVLGMFFYVPWGWGNTVHALAHSHDVTPRHVHLHVRTYVMLR